MAAQEFYDFLSAIQYKYPYLSINNDSNLIEKGN